jgi:hypothetical protein
VRAFRPCAGRPDAAGSLDGFLELGEHSAVPRRTLAARTTHAAFPSRDRDTVDPDLLRESALTNAGRFAYRARERWRRKSTSRADFGDQIVGHRPGMMHMRDTVPVLPLIVGNTYRMHLQRLSGCYSAGT